MIAAGIVLTLGPVAAFFVLAALASKSDPSLAGYLIGLVMLLALPSIPTGIVLLWIGLRRRSRVRGTADAASEKKAGSSDSTAAAMLFAMAGLVVALGFLVRYRIPLDTWLGFGGPSAAAAVLAFFGLPALVLGLLALRGAREEASVWPRAATATGALLSLAAVLLPFEPMAGKFESGNAQALLQAARGHEENHPYAGIVHSANIRLGFAALQQGRIKDASRHLVEAGKTIGSPQLDTFGPDLTLAAALLAQGEGSAVVEYLRHCANFWDHGQGRLERWITLIEAGQKPALGLALPAAPLPAPGQAVIGSPAAARVALWTQARDYTTPGLRVSEASFSGNAVGMTARCPMEFSFVARVSASGAPGTALHRFVYSDGVVSWTRAKPMRGNDALGTSRIFDAGFSGSAQLQVIAPAEFESKPFKFRIECLPPGDNLALNKPATQSSTSQWSRGNDAQGAVDGKVDGGFGFHTDRQANPWWQVDLETVHDLGELRIFNRTHPETIARARTMRVLLSEDGVNWRNLYAHDGSLFGGYKSSPLTLRMNREPARFVRLQLNEETWLHLDEVEIYGAPALSRSSSSSGLAGK